jgi:hypothetical protein
MRLPRRYWFPAGESLPPLSTTDARYRTELGDRRVRVVWVDRRGIVQGRGVPFKDLQAFADRVYAHRGKAVRWKPPGGEFRPLPWTARRTRAAELAEWEAGLE